MRFNSSTFFCTFVLSAMIVAHSSPAFAASAKYKRPKSGGVSTDSGTAAPSDASSATSSSSDKAGASSGTPAAGTSNGEKKVDLSDLESRYWTAKDTEFNVVQNRLYTKAHRFALTVQGGTVFNDQYTTNYNLGLNLNYYFSERQGVEFQFWKTFASDADFVNDFGNRFGVIPDHNMPQGYYGVSYNWVPIYAKMSLLEKRILYFDMSVSPGIGFTSLKADTFASPPTFVSPTAVQSNPVTFALDVAQQVFIDEHWAIRLDMRNHFYSETVYGAGSGSSVRSKFTYASSIMFGATYFFGTGSK